MKRGVVFDIDDTLYLERDYVMSGFRAVARRVAEDTQLAEEDVLGFLVAAFERGVRGTTFDELIESFPTSRIPPVAALVKVYRSHEPAIALSGSVRSELVSLHETGWRVGVISDGPSVSQRAKASALGLAGFADPVILTGDWGVHYAKPHPRSYETIETTWQIPAAELTYVADNPAKDFITPNRRGWRTVRVRRSGQQHAHADAPAPDHAAQVEVPTVEAACRQVVSGML